MEYTDAIKKRRTIYALGKEIKVAEDVIIEKIKTCITHSPSAFNSQSSRLVYLTNHNHDYCWDLVIGKLSTIVHGDDFITAKNKVDNCFKSAFGTILFFEDTKTVKGFQEMFPAYAENFDVWSQHGSAIIQYMVWTALAEEGLGASLQHYGNLIGEDIKKKFNLPEEWSLIAQMPFGVKLKDADHKDALPMTERFYIP